MGPPCRVGSLAESGKSNDWQKQVRAATQSSATSGRGALYAEFWSRFFERLKNEHPNWRRWSTPAPQDWISMTAAIKGTWFSLSFGQPDRLRSELCIGTGDDQRNLELLALLETQQELIERSYGRALSWEELPNRHTCRIADYVEGCNVEQSERFDEFIDWFFDSSMRFRRALEEASATIPGLDLKPGSLQQTAN